MPGFGHGSFSKAARDKRNRMKKILSKYDGLSKAGGGLPVPKSPTPPPPPSAAPPKDWASAALDAVLSDDILRLDSIHAQYNDVARWMIVSNATIGSEWIKMPLVFHATKGTGAALDWLIAHGADLTAESNFAISPVVAFAASTGREKAAMRLLTAMGVDDVAVTFGPLSFKHLSDVAKHFGYEELSAALVQRRTASAIPQAVVHAKDTPAAARDGHSTAHEKLLAGDRHKKFKLQPAAPKPVRRVPKV